MTIDDYEQGGNNVNKEFRIRELEEKVQTITEILQMQTCTIKEIADAIQVLIELNRRERGD
jgi:hypothetical protein